MANWSNVRLIVAGPRADLLHFSHLAKTQPSSVFQPDMLEGESGELYACRARKIGPKALKKSYRFQMRNDDGHKHFRLISRQYPTLCFVLVYGDPNCDCYGSYFISRGRARNHELPGRVKEAVMAKHGVTEEYDEDEDWRFWFASWELLDVAEGYWIDAVLRAIES
jgi:hypothetical protein